MSTDEVEALLGKPLRTAGGPSIVWEYDFTRRLKECRFFLGPIPLQRARTERHDVELRFTGNVLRHAVYREVSPDVKTERILVGTPNANEVNSRRR